MKLEHSLTPYKKIKLKKKIKFKEIEDLNVKFLEENTGRTLWHKMQECIFGSVS